MLSTFALFAVTPATPRALHLGLPSSVEPRFPLKRWRPL